MEVAGNILRFQAIFFIKIEKSVQNWQQEDGVLFSGIKGKVVLDLVTDWFRKMFSFLEEGAGPYFFVFLPKVKKFKLNDT